MTLDFFSHSRFCYKVYIDRSYNAQKVGWSQTILLFFRIFKKIFGYNAHYLKARKMLYLSYQKIRILI